jgi:arylformamidase
MTGDPYAIRDVVPEFDAVAAELAARGAATLARPSTRIAYGPGARETVDVVFPDRPAAGAPLHLFVHGGYWRSGTVAAYACAVDPVLAAGGVAALAEYDLMPGVRLAAIVAQVRRAAAALRAAAPGLGADPARFTASGHSAGAHLAALLAAAAPGEAAPPALGLAGLLLVSGIYDLAPIPGSFLKAETGMTADEAAAWSPLAARHDAAPRRVVTRGAAETAPFHDDAVRLAAGLDPARTELRSETGRDHMTVVLALSDVADPLGRRLADLVAGG